MAVRKSGSSRIASVIKTAWQSPRARVKTLGGGLFIILGLIVPLILSQTAQAYVLIEQSDWSGGQGSNGSNQYDSVDNITVNGNGKLTLNTGNMTNWCATANCDTSWTNRKPVVLTNAGGSTIDHEVQVQLTVQYHAAMKSDFSDLRFSSADGATELAHFVQSKSDSSSALVLVRLPANTVPAGNTTTYMYFGNAAASSTSTTAATLATGQFDADGPLDPRWHIYNGSPQIVNNEVPLLNGQHSDFVLNLGSPAHQTATRVVETSIQITGTAPTSQNNYIGTIAFSNYTNVDFGIDSSSYDDEGNFNKLAINSIYRNNEFIPNYGSNGPLFSFNYNDVLHFKATFYSGLGEDSEILMSTNGGPYVTIAARGSGSAPAYPTPQFKNNSSFSDGLYDAYIVKDLTMYTVSEELSSAVGGIEYQGGKSGSLTSVVYDLGGASAFGNLNFDTNGIGASSVRLRTSNSGTMSGAPEFTSCPLLADNTQLISSDGCVENGHRYIQYQVVLAEPPGQAVVFEAIQFEYVNDSQPPDSNASNLEARVTREYSPGYKVIPDNGWANTKPSFNWQAGVDNSGGSGIKGYCLYFGGDPEADPTADSGLLDSSSSPLDTNGACPFAVATTTFEPFVKLDSDDDGFTGYFKIKVIDQLNNVYSGESTSTSLRFDFTEPQLNTIFTGPQGVINNPIFNVTWPGPSSGGQFFDGTSGFAGLKYCITSAQAGFAGCFLGTEDPDSYLHWYGANHTGEGQIDNLDDVFDPNSEVFTTVPADATRLDEGGLNAIVVGGVDNAGNFGSLSEEAGNGILFVNMSQIAPSAPTNLQVTPTSSNQNSFSFTWEAPDELIGSVEAVDYCWTVNVTPVEDGNNCNWTGQGITQLAAGPYATQQGSNTLYLVAKDQATNFDVANVASVNFSAATAAPGTPQDLEISDVSIRSTSTWRLALSWAPPEQGDDIIANYRVLRSTDNANFASVGATSSTNTSFIDSGLSQVDYYYKIVACDNAASCGVASNVVTKKPTGRFTEPAKLTADSDQPVAKDIGTKKATIQWYTDRESDSKVALGTEPGSYFSEEIGSSNQVANHNVLLSNLQPGTRYYYVAKWTDQDGNTGQSSERSFTTAPAPKVSEVSTSNISLNNLKINFTSENASKVKLYYGPSEAFGGLQEINTSAQKSTYSLNVEGLSDGTKYFFKLATLDGDGNEYPGDIYSFNTLPRPIISNLRFQPVEGATSSTQRVTWNTNVPATSEISLSPAGGKAQEQLKSALTTTHEVTIAGLNDDTDYILVARSRDGAGNLAQSTPQNFKTALDTRPPKVSNLKVEASVRQSSDTSKGQLVVSWQTDEPSTSQVTYGLGQTGPYTNTSTEDSRMTLEHVVVISELSPSSIYHLKALSTDKGGNQGESSSHSVIIGRGSENVFSIIFRALQQIFGLEGSLVPIQKVGRDE